MMINPTPAMLVALQLIEERGSYPFHEVALRARGSRWRLLKRMAQAGFVHSWPARMTKEGRRALRQYREALKP